jgi:hypothetical protein
VSSMAIGGAILLVIAVIVLIWESKNAKFLREKGDMQSYIRYLNHDSAGWGFVMGLFVAFFVLWLSSQSL